MSKSIPVTDGTNVIYTIELKKDFGDLCKELTRLKISPDQKLCIVDILRSPPDRRHRQTYARILGVFFFAQNTVMYFYIFFLQVKQAKTRIP